MSSSDRLSKAEEMEARKFADMLDAGNSKVLYDAVIEKQRELWNKYSIRDNKVGPYDAIMRRAEQLEKPNVGLDMVVFDSTGPDHGGMITHIVGTNKTTVEGNGIEITLPYVDNIFGTSERLDFWSDGAWKVTSKDGKIGENTWPDELKEGVWGSFKLHAWGPHFAQNYFQQYAPKADCTTRTYTDGTKETIFGCAGTNTRK